MYIALAVGLSATGLAPVATAMERPSRDAPVAPVDQSDPQTRALAQAQRSGEPVEVKEFRTETEEVVANPSGSLTLTQHNQVVRVRKGRELVPVDTTLARRGERIAPRATALDVTFSAGGDARLATLHAQGRDLSIEWPAPLPAPELNGEEATYPEVLPGVDLKVRAGAETVSQVLVVKNAQAAQNPALKQLELGMKSSGLTLKEDTASGTLRALNPAGQEVFSSATPRMWDSSGTPPTPAKMSSRAASSDAANTPGDLEPGNKNGDVGVEFTPNSMTLIPDQKILNSADTIYPVYIDPKFTGARKSWTIAYSKAPNSSFLNGTGWSGGTTSEARVGYEQQTGGKARSIFQFDPRPFGKAQIISAQLNVANTHSWSCAARPVEVWLTSAISSTTTWNNQPNWGTKLQTLNFAHGNESFGCADKGVTFNVTAAAERAAASSWPVLALGLRANESDTYSWKKFRTDPTLVVEYNHAPRSPSGLGTNPSTACTANPSTTIGNTDVQLYAKISDPDGGTLKARFIVWRTGVTGNIFDRTVSVTNNSVARVTVPRDSLIGHAQHSWQVQASDGRILSSWAPGDPPCRFIVDKTRPSNQPTVTSVEYPNGDDGTYGAVVGTLGTFTLGSGGVGDIVQYSYGLTDPPTNIVKPASPGGSVKITFRPERAGPHVLYVVSRDGAGNVSDGHRYAFYVRGKEAGKVGDLNGDGHTDLWGVTTAGKLVQYPGTGDGSLGIRLDASKSDFTNSLVTRRGDFNRDNNEDLVARHPDGKLWLYPGTLYGTVDDARRLELSQTEPFLDTSKITQLVSIGDATGDSCPDLLAKVGDQLWFLAGNHANYIANAYPIADTGWQHLTLSAPGDMTGDSHPDLLVRNTTTGKVQLHHGMEDEYNGGIDIDRLINGTPTEWASTGILPTQRKLLTSPGDINGDGTVDMWATSPDGTGSLFLHPTQKNAQNLPVSGTPVQVGPTSWNTLVSLT
ncbi:DNRLRE domain-containing protein [Streptomyces sp. CA-294286]|uniref:DNRLRE domain-containing protein n=1 Tax=Streptomyces sp. CA-294286 TaxID=3240070 RepID=UPI003D8AC2EE